MRGQDRQYSLSIEKPVTKIYLRGYCVVKKPLFSVVVIDCREFPTNSEARNSSAMYNAARFQANILANILAIFFANFFARKLAIFLS